MANNNARYFTSWRIAPGAGGHTSLDLDSVLSTFGSMELQRETPATLAIDGFTRFPEFPSELRSKIFEHAMSDPQVLYLHSDVLVADSEFGLYLTFRMASQLPTIRRDSFAPLPKRPSYKTTRVLNLRQVCKEANEAYLRRYPITLPYSPKGIGKLRISRHDTVYWYTPHCDAKLFWSSIHSSAPFRLQSWWREIEILQIKVQDLITTKSLSQLVTRMTKLTLLRAMVWHTAENQREGVHMMFERHLHGLRTFLEVYQEDVDPYYVLPKLELAMETEE